MRSLRASDLSEARVVDDVSVALRADLEVNEPVNEAVLRLGSVGDDLSTSLDSVHSESVAHGLSIGRGVALGSSGSGLGGHVSGGLLEIGVPLDSLDGFCSIQEADGGLSLLDSGFVSSAFLKLSDSGIHHGDDRLGVGPSLVDQSHQILSSKVHEGELRHVEIVLIVEVIIVEVHDVEGVLVHLEVLEHGHLVEDGLLVKDQESRDQLS